MAAIFHSSCVLCLFLMAVVSNHVSLAECKSHFSDTLHDILLNICFKHFASSEKREHVKPKTETARCTPVTQMFDEGTI